MAGWNAHDIPDLSGRRAVVTGANSGIGYTTARALAGRRAHVVLACRDETRALRALDRLHAEVPDAQAEFIRLDLGDLQSIREFATTYSRAHDDLALLINNAGVMAVPQGRTKDGFETQFGINHLGHFALTGLLLPLLLATPGARVVSVSSTMHAAANIDIRDLGSEQKYRRWTAYGRSKTANLLFIHELARRLTAIGSEVVAAAAHPGYAATNLQTASPSQEGRKAAERFMRIGNRFFAQSAESGALPTLYAATAPDVRPDSFTGPAVMGWRGSPARSWRAPWSLDDRAGELLWEESERLTGVVYEELKR